MPKATKIASNVQKNAAPKAPKAAPAPIAPPTETGTLGDGAADIPTNLVKPQVEQLLAQNNGSAFTAEERATPPAPMPTIDNADFRPVKGQKTKEMTVLLVMIKRGVEEIPGEAFKHEIPILREIHLPENVKVIDSEYSAVDVPDSAGAEHARLKNKYRQHLNVVDRIYPLATDLVRAAGLKDDTDDFGEVPQADVQINRRKPSKA